MTNANDRASGSVFACEIQARLRDVNSGGHVDNVEAIRVLDEARILFFHHARLDLGDAEARGLLSGLPGGVAELVGSQRIDYHSEMRFIAFQPFLVNVWVSHIGRSSFAISSAVRAGADHEAAVLAETTLVLWDRAAGSSWTLTDPVRARLEHFRGPRAQLR